MSSTIEKNRLATQNEALQFNIQAVRWWIME